MSPSGASDLLDRCPRRRLEWREEEQHVVVLRPKFGESRLGSWLARQFGVGAYRVRLDDLGSAVWQCCDGRMTLREIAQQMRTKFGDRVEPAEERVARFARTMARSRLIDL